MTSPYLLMNMSIIMVSSKNADFNNHIYTSIYVIGDTNQSIVLNGTNYSFSPKVKFDVDVYSVGNSNDNIYLIGYDKPIFPEYLGNPPHFNVSENPIIDSIYWVDGDFWNDNNFWYE